MILVRRNEKDTYELVNGEMRFRTMLELRGSAEVVDIETRETLTVHEVGGELVVLNQKSQKAVDDAAAAAIESVRDRKA